MKGYLSKKDRFIIGLLLDYPEFADKSREYDYGSALEPGPSNEDRIYNKVIGDKMLTGVFDGHGGSEASSRMHLY